MLKAVPPRAEQISEALAMTAILRDQGWSKVTYRVTRGGTVEVSVEAADGAKVGGVMPLSRRQR
jgi:hypothetical protein